MTHWQLDSATGSEVQVEGKLELEVQVGSLILPTTNSTSSGSTLLLSS